VEVARSVAVLDGAVLVVDAVAGVQAQTETVWKSISATALPSLALINKMDKVGSNFQTAIRSIQRKLVGANPIPIQVPIFVNALGQHSLSGDDGNFVGVVDLIQQRAIVWPDSSTVSQVETCIPQIVNLQASIQDEVARARLECIEALAECDEEIEEMFLNEREPTVDDFYAALRRVTLAQKAIPTMLAAALKGKGVEPLLDAVAQFLPCPLDRPPPRLLAGADTNTSNTAAQGHPLHPSLLALAFKVVHMKGRGGSGDGRVVFVRVYSGSLVDRSVVHVISPPKEGESVIEPARKERVGGMLELKGGKFDHLDDGVCHSGEVCALVGLKTVTTGDTIFIAGTTKKKKPCDSDFACLAGVSPPKPVLKVRLEAASTQHQDRLSDALALLAVEDPSLVVEETESATLLSGLGELHVEVTLDRLKREFDLDVMVGPPSVTYRETVSEVIGTDGLCNYDALIGDKRLQASVELVIEPAWDSIQGSCIKLQEPLIIAEAQVKEFLGIDPDSTDDEAFAQCNVFQALIQGCRGALTRGPLKSQPLSAAKCTIKRIDAEGGPAFLQALPGAMRAAVANAVCKALSSTRSSCRVLEPTMFIEISCPNDSVGAVLSDLTGNRRGSIGDVMMGEGNGSKASLQGDVPLAAILGYANSLRSLTAGEGSFTAHYKGHSVCDEFS
jgi:elongation factor G